MGHEVLVLTDDAILEQLKNILQTFNIDPAKVTSQANLLKDLSLDSLDVVEFAMRVEEFYRIEFTSDEENDLMSVRQAIELVKKYTV